MTTPSHHAVCAPVSERYVCCFVLFSLPLRRLVPGSCPQSPIWRCQLLFVENIIWSFVWHVITFYSNSIQSIQFNLFTSFHFFLSCRSNSAQCCQPYRLVESGLTTQCPCQLKTLQCFIEANSHASCTHHCSHPAWSPFRLECFECADPFRPAQQCFQLGRPFASKWEFDNIRTPQCYAPLNSLVCLEWCALLTQVFDLLSVCCHKLLRWRFSLTFDMWEHRFRHHMTCGSGVRGDSGFHPLVFHLHNLLRAQIVTAVCFICWSLPASFCCLPVCNMPADPLHFQLILQYSQCHLRPRRTGSCFLLSLHQAAMCPVLPHVQHVLVSPLPPFSCPLPPFLLLPFCLELCLPSLPPFSFQFWPLLKPPLSFASSFVYSLQSEVYNPLVSLLARILTIFFRCHSDLHGIARVMFPASGCRNHRYLVNDDVLQRTLFLWTCSSACFLASISWLILPNLFSNLFISFKNVLRMSSNCSTSFVLSFSKMLLVSTAYADLFVRHVPLIVPSHCGVPCFESLLSFRLLHYFQWFCGGPGTAMPQLIWTLHLSNRMQLRFVKSVDALDPGKHLFSLIWPRLHPQVQVRQEASELSLCSMFCCGCRYCCCRSCCGWPRSCLSVSTRGVAHRRSATMSSATLFCGTTWANASALEEWSSACNKQGWKQGSKCAGVQQCQVCARFNRERARE